GAIGFRLFVHGGVFFLAHGPEAELPGDQLDLIEVQPLVDRDHEPEVLEREGDNLRGWNLEDGRQLADGDELVHAHRGAFALRVRGALRLDLLAIAAVLAAPRTAPRRRSAQCRHGSRDVRAHRFLIHRAALPLLALAATLVI